MQASLLVPRRDDKLYRRETSLNFIVGGLRLQLAETDEERFAAQRLRYRVFFGEMGATTVAAAERHQIDVDEYKDIADHVIVTDTLVSIAASLSLRRIVSSVGAGQCAAGSNIAPINSTLHVY